MNTIERPKVITKRFKVVAISTNRGSFGHSGHILISEDGIAVEGDRQRTDMNPTIPNLNRGDILTFEVDKDGMPKNWIAHNFEFMAPARQGNPPKALVDEVWSPNFGAKG
jgi:hypothetical protein